MSDLQCPATLLIACHGDAEYVLGGALSDDGGWLTDLGRAQVGELAETLRSRRIAAVYSSTMKGAVESADLVAKDLGVKRFVVNGIQEPSVGEAGHGCQDPRAHRVFDAWLQGNLDAGYPGGEDGHTIVTRFKAALEHIADSHRGETVLVFTHSRVMSLVIPRIALNVRNDVAAQRIPHNCLPVEVEVDADGWRVISWPSTSGAVVADSDSEQA